MSHRQLSQDERYQIQALLRAQRSQADIARELGRNPSTISRELSRNTVEGMTHPYLAQRACKLTHGRRVAKGVASRKIQGELQDLVEQKLRLSWSPEQISGRLRLELCIFVSHECIYQHVIRDAKNLGFLRYCLRFGGYKHHRCKKSKMAERTRERKNWIDERPAAANERRDLGHWERDCVVGNPGSSVILTMVDRRSRYTRIRHVQKLDTAHVGEATAEILAPYKRFNKTLTNDNGVEFQRDSQLQIKIDIPIYFCDPASPWQRGTIENTNGLIRQFLRKGSSFDKLPAWTAAAVEETLNYRPRKTLGYRTPHEIFHNQTLYLTQEPLMRFGLEFSRPT